MVSFQHLSSSARKIRGQVCKTLVDSKKKNMPLSEPGQVSAALLPLPKEEFHHVVSRQLLLASLSFDAYSF